MITLKNYQEVAIKDLLDDAIKLLNRTGNKKLVFKSPTGSGKTIMVAEFIKRLVESNQYGNELAFIWTAPRKLHEQSKEKLELYYESTRTIQCSYFEELSDRQIQANEILFFNWESINKKDNVYIRENENDNNLSSIVEKTKLADRHIVLLVDESHHHATSDISQELVNDIGPDLTIEISATPVMENPDEMVTVDIEDVKVEGMIKKSVILNPGFKNTATGNDIKSETISVSSNEFIIDEAIKLRAEIVSSYKDIDKNINPLILVQLPNSINSTAQDTIDDIQKILETKHKITTQNGKLAIYLSENSVNLENISKNDNEVEVLLFKQAISLGWDCPRAHILALFRDWSSRTFSIQTVGRIMRMPEPLEGHYNDEVLNHGYVFTNLSDINIADDTSKGYITIYTSKRIEDYKPIKLESVYRERHREQTRLSPLFTKIFLHEAENYGLKNKINVNDQKVSMGLISDWQAENIDTLADSEIKATFEVDNATPETIQRMFDLFVIENLSPYHPEDRSIGRVKETLYKFFHKILSINYMDDFEKVIRIILSDTNNRYFKEVIDQTKEQYEIATKERENVLQVVKNWEIPESLSLTGNYTEWTNTKSVLQPFYYDNKWKSEKAFIEFIENNKDKVEWWFKNGDRDAVFFAVEYEEAGEMKPFYVDFIIKFTNGKLGLFDTKSGITARDAENKAIGLNNYIKENANNLVGGLITNTDEREYKGRWQTYDVEKKEWVNFELL